MHLTIWNIIGMFCAGAASVALGATIAGFLAYKIKYAGRELFHEKQTPNAESFIIDDDFLDDDYVPDTDPTKPENQPAILKGNKSFVEQFTRDRIIAAGDRSDEEEAA